MLFKEFSGKRAEWKRDLAESLVFDPCELEYHQGFLDWLNREHDSGRTLVLATASDRIIAEQVAGQVAVNTNTLQQNVSNNSNTFMQTRPNPQNNEPTGTRLSAVPA